METFILCDLHGYEILVRGELCGHDAASLASVIGRLPDDCSAVVDLVGAAFSDPMSLRIVAAAAVARSTCGVEISVVAATPAAASWLIAAGFTDVVLPRLAATA